jgi:hypothetical protein
MRLKGINMKSYKDYQANQTPLEKSESQNSVKTEQIKKALENSSVITGTPTTDYSKQTQLGQTVANAIADYAKNQVAKQVADGFTDDVYKNSAFNQSYNNVEDFANSFGNKLGMSWQKTSPFDFLGLTDNLQSAIDPVKSGIDTIKTIVDLVVAVIDFVANLLILTANVVQAVLTAFIKLLEAVRDLLVNTNISFLNASEKALTDKNVYNQLINKAVPSLKTNQDVIPNLLTSSYYTPNETLRRISLSYDDEFDKNRPVGITTGDIHLIVMPYLLAPNIGSIILLYTQLLALLDKKAFQSIFDRISNMSNPDYVNSLRDRQYPYYLYKDGVGQSPNWSKRGLRDITGVDQVVNSLNKLIATLKVANSAVELFKQAVRLFQQRLAQMKAVIDRILTAIQDLIQLTTIPIGSLTMFGTGNIDTVQQSFLESISHPTSPFQEKNDQGELLIQSQANVSMLACVLHLQLGTGSAIDFLKALFSVRDAAVTVLTQHPSKDTNIQTSYDKL